MSSLIRSAKLGRDWTINDLLAFNIQVVPKDYPNFFGIDRLPPPAVSPLILHHETMPVYLKDIPKHHKNRSDWKFYQLLSDIIHPSPGQEPPVDDFAMFLLDMMDFDEGERVTRRWREMSFVMCGQRVSAETDVCVMQTINETATYYILLVLKGPWGRRRHRSTLYRVGLRGLF